jgi:hypothetical protein
MSALATPEERPGDEAHAAARTQTDLKKQSNRPKTRYSRQNRFPCKSLHAEEAPKAPSRSMRAVPAWKGKRKAAVYLQTNQCP